MLIKYCVFSLKFGDFLNSVSSAAALVYVHTMTPRENGKTEKGQSPNYFKILGKNTIFNEHPVPLLPQTLSVKSWVGYTGNTGISQSAIKLFEIKGYQK